jgi:DNA-binding transcriptional LysR family regulator
MVHKDHLIRRLKVRDLRMLEIIAVRGSMARAAEELGLSQPAISKAIADLERDLGVSVLDRNTRGVDLTESGRVLLQRGRVILDELRQGLSEIENLSDPTAGLVSIGATPGQSLFIAAVIERTSRRYPKMKFSVDLADPLRLIRALRDREHDLIICRAQMSEHEPDLRSETLLRDRIEVVVAPTHPLARRRKIALTDLVEERWALAPVESYLGGLVQRAFHSQSLSMPQAVVWTPSIQLRFELMETGGFITVASHSMVTHPTRRGRVKTLPVAFGDDAGPMAAITLKARQLTRVSTLVLEEARSVASPIAGMERSSGQF